MQLSRFQLTRNHLIILDSLRIFTATLFTRNHVFKRDEWPISSWEIHLMMMMMLRRWREEMRRGLVVIEMRRMMLMMIETMMIHENMFHWHLAFSRRCSRHETRHRVSRSVELLQDHVLEAHFNLVRRHLLSAASHCSGRFRNRFGPNSHCA